MSARRVSEAEVIAEFADALAAAGFLLRGPPMMDGAWHRAAVDGDKGTARSGRYRGYLDGIRPAGFIENFRDATRTGAWKFGGALVAMTPAEAEAMRHRHAEIEARRERERAALALVIAAEAERRWEAAAPALACHPYLARKRIQPHGSRVSGSGKLLVPMHDLADGRLACLQEIAPGGTKLFAKGASTSGRDLLLGSLAPGAVLLIAEGFATGATLRESTGLAVAVAFSKANFATIARAYADRFPGLRVGICGDNDHEHRCRDPPLRNVGRDAAEAAARETDGVAILPEELPERAAAGKGSDWNDMCVLRGPDAVRQAIEAALAAAFPPARHTAAATLPHYLLPHHPLPTFTAAEARAEVARRIAGFLARTKAWHEATEAARGLPEHAGLAVEVAAGKTTIACESLPGFIAEMKACGLPHRILYTVPEHKLGGEVLARLAGLGIRAAVWRGRTYQEPNSDNFAMCDNVGAVFDALAAGEIVETAACGSPGGAVCPHRGTCGYQLQKAPAAAADVVVAAHDIMTRPLPAAIGRGFALTVTDEDWLDRGVSRPSVAVQTLRAGESAHPVLHEGDPHRPDDLKTNDLHVLRRRLADATDATDASDGRHLSRAALQAVGLTAKDCRMASGLEWRRKVTGALRPGMGAEARREAMQRCAGNAAIPRLSALWKAAAALLEGEGEASGRVELSRSDTAKGSQRAFELNLLADLADAVTALPMLLLDATMPATLLRHRLPGLKVLAEVRAVAPDMRVHQILVGSGKTSLVPYRDGKEDGLTDKQKKENQRRRNRLAEMRDFIAARTGGARALVITYKAITHHFAGLPGVEVAHFGAIAGRDEWGPQPGRPGVRFLFIIGRPMAAPEDTRRLAAALTGRPMPVQMAERVTRLATMRDGTTRPIEAHAYADPDLEAVRAAVTETALVQGGGRGRGINRTAANPLDVCVLADDVVLPLPLDSLTDWRDVAPGPFERMAARGVVLTSPRDAARAYPDIFGEGEKGHAAAKQAMKRDRDRARGRGDFSDIPLRGLFIGECHRNTGWYFTYRPPGRGQQFRQGRAPAAMDPEDVLAWLIVKLGDVETFAPEDPPGMAEQPPAPAAAPIPLAEARARFEGVATRLEAAQDTPIARARGQLAEIGARLEGRPLEPLRQHVVWQLRQPDRPHRGASP